MYGVVRRKVFISFYQADRLEVEEFVEGFEDVFIERILGAGMNEDIVRSTNPEYVMQQIRQRYLRQSTVTIVGIGTCTHSRRYVDWEIKSSLRRAAFGPAPNGLIGMYLPSLGYGEGWLPERLGENVESGYATVIDYPEHPADLVECIEDAHSARTARAPLIRNSQAMMRHNAVCQHCGINHLAG